MPSIASPLRTLSLLSVAVFLLGANTAEAAKTLRWKFKVGDQFKVSTTQKFKQILTIEEKTYEIPNTTEMWMTWKVAEVNDEVTRVTQVIDRVKVAVRVPGGGEVRFDSDEEDDPTGPAKNIAEVMRPMIGAEFVQVMTDRGQIVKVEVPSEALEGLHSHQELKGFFSEDAFSELMQKVSPAMPTDAIEPGHQWKTSSATRTMAGNLLLTGTYTYDGEVQREDRALEKISSTVEVGFESETPGGGKPVEILKQDNSGTSFFDAEAGHVVEVTMSQRIHMSVTVRDKSFDQKLETSLNMKVNRITP